MGRFGKQGRKDFGKLTAAKKKVEAKKKSKVKMNTKKIALTVNASTIQSEPEKVKTLIKHYKKDAQIMQALIETKTFFQSCSEPVQYLTLIYPEIFSIITHEEMDVRKKLKEVIQYLLNRFDASPLQSNLPTVITYICSGLTHLSKNIRFTTLEIFAIIHDKMPDSIFDYFAKVFPLLITLLNEKSILDAVSADALRSSSSTLLEHPPSSSSGARNKDSQQQSSRENSSRPKAIFHLLLSVLESMGLYRKDEGKGAHSKKTNQLLHVITPVVLLGEKLQWISALATTVNHSYQPERSIEDLIGQFVDYLQKIIRDFIGISGRTLTLSFVHLLARLLNILAEFMERYDFCREKLCITSDLLNIFPFQLRDEEQNQLAFMKLKVLNLKIAEILSKHSEQSSSHRQQVIAKCKQYVYASLDDIQVSEIIQATSDVIGKEKEDEDERKMEEENVVVEKKSEKSTDEEMVIRKQLYQGIFSNLTNYLDHLEDMRRVLHKLSTLTQNLLPHYSSSASTVLIDPHLMNGLMSTLQEIIIRGLMFPETELIGFITSLTLLASTVILLSLQRAHHRSIFLTNSMGWLQLVRELLLRMGDLWEKDQEQTIHHQQIELFKSHLIELYRSSASSSENQPFLHLYRFNDQSEAFQLAWINLLKYIPKTIFLAVSNHIQHDYFSYFSHTVQEQFTFVTNCRKDEMKRDTPFAIELTD